MGDHPGIDRRLFIGLAGGAAAAALMGLASHADAAEARGSICLYSRGFIARRARFRPASPRARGMVDQISRAIGYRGPIEIHETRSISNAAAVPGRRGRPHLILYNADFMNRLDRMHPAAPIGVLAHEIGHFTDGSQAARSTWDRELAADHAGGCIMARIGADEAAATVALRALRSGPSRSHPDSGTRVRAAADGHRVCRG